MVLPISSTAAHDLRPQFLLTRRVRGSPSTQAPNVLGAPAMSIVVMGVFLSLAAIAAAFVCWPVAGSREMRPAARAMLAGSLGLLVAAIGGGAYVMLGTPYLALRSVSPPSAADLRGLIAVLAQRIRERPNDPAGWTLLGRGYLTLNDPSDAAAAFRRALRVAPARQRPMLYSAYGEALTAAAGGAVSAEAEAAFSRALLGNPRDFAARYYLGQAYASRHENARALALWEGLLADAPSGAPWRSTLVDRIALLKGQRASAAPDVGAMVAGLARRLHERPDDPEGWLQLVRAYAVLGDAQKANATLAEARVVLRGNSQGLARLSLEAKNLRLQK